MTEIKQMITPQTTRKSIVIVDMQPVTIEGVRVLLDGAPDLKYSGAVSTLPSGMELVRSLRPSIVLIDKGFGMQAISDWLTTIRGSKTAVIVWGSGIGNAEALRLMQSGARGVIQKTSELDSFLTCLRTIADGGAWMADSIFKMTEPESRPRSNLTTREQQVADLVERGMRNKEIGHALGIQTGTVKIHLKHIFEKTGCRGRYGLALSGLRSKGHFTQPVM